jgi:hypothetical protein
MKRLCVLLVLAACFSAPAQPVRDTAKVGQGAVLQAADSLSAISGLSGLPLAQKIKIIKKEFDYSTSVKLALGMMAFIAVILFTSQSWNPGGVNE